MEMTKNPVSPQKFFTETEGILMIDAQDGVVKEGVTNLSDAWHQASVVCGHLFADIGSVSHSGAQYPTAY
jgi:hypothetical protein